MTSSNTAPASDLDARIDAFWPVPFQYRYDATLEEQFKTRRTELEREYGPATWKRFMAYSDALQKNRHDQKLVRDAAEFIYASGLYRAVHPEFHLRGRSTLDILARDLGARDAELTLIDLGCGDAMLDIGLATFVPNVKRVIAIDSAPSAIMRAKENIARFSRDGYLRASLVEPQHADFTDAEVRAQLLGYAQTGSHVLLAAYPSNSDEAFSTLAPLTKHAPAYVCIGTGLHWEPDEDEEEATARFDGRSFELTDSITSRAFDYGMASTEIATKRYVPNDMFTIMRLEEWKPQKPIPYSVLTQMMGYGD